MVIRFEYDSEIIDIHEYEQVTELYSSYRTQTRLAAEAKLIRSPFPMTVQAFCGCCGKVQPIEFSARHSAQTPNGGISLAYSETGVCPECRINSRMRFACDVIDSVRPSETKQLYVTETVTHLYAALKRKFPNITGSEYLGPDKTSGQIYDDVEHQDLHALTYPDCSFDAVLCLDVIEHLNDPVTAVSEVYRVLKSGGVGVVTMPFYARPNSVIRSKLDEDGNIVTLLPEVYHGNPLGGGALVFQELGWEFVAGVKERLGEANAEFISYWSLYRAHFGLHRFAFIIKKP